MAKELPYFRFTPQEWQNGSISLERNELKGLFIDLCCYYWIKDCSITVAMLEKKYSNAKELLKELFEMEILYVKNKNFSEANFDDFVNIDFLNEQFDTLSKKRKLRQRAGSKGGKKKSSNAKAMLKQKSSYKDKDKDKDKEVEFKYSKFYDEQITKCNNDKLYIQFVEFLFGNNDIERQLNKCLSYKDQISYKSFKKYIDIYGKDKLKEKILNLENDTKGKYASFNLTINNWLRK